MPATEEVAEIQELTLRAASLFKNGFSIDWIIQLIGAKPSVMIEVLERAAKDEVLKKTDYSRFSFCDDGTKLSYKEKLLPEVTEQFRKKITELLLRELPDDEEKADQLADILLENENDLQHCRWLAKAGDIYNHSFKAASAIRCFEKALEDLLKISGTAADELFIETTLKYARIADAVFNIHKIIHILEAALQKAKKRDDLKSIALILMQMAKNEWYRSNYPQALRLFKEGWEISKTVNDPKLRTSALNFSTFFHYWQGLFKEAVDLYESEITGFESSEYTRFQLMTDSMVGQCYTLIGRAAQGFGMMTAVRSECMKAGDFFMGSINALTIAISLIDIQRFKEAKEYIAIAAKEAEKWPDSPLQMIVQLLKLYEYYREGNQKKAVILIKQFLKLRQKIEVSMWPYPYLMEICWEIETGRFPNVPGLSFKKEIELSEESGNIFMAGIALRFKAMLKNRNHAPKEEVYALLEHSEKNLLQSGHLTELLRTRLTIYHFYIEDGQTAKADMISGSIATRLSGVPPAMVPPDLLPFRRAVSDTDNFSDKMNSSGEKIMTIGNSDRLLRHIVNTSNRLLGAERGAIFPVMNKTTEFVPLAASNLTEDQIDEPVFDRAKKAIERTISSGKGLVENYEISIALKGNSIRSLICIPLMVKNRLEGVLYHDHRMLMEAFQDRHLKLPGYFTAMVALAVNNHLLEHELDSIHKGALPQVSSENPVKKTHYGIIGQSHGIRRVLSMIHQVADADTTVLILGETGTGKELVAKAIHDSGNRSNGPFISVNCSALPDTLISSELFGHEKGAFTGAQQQRRGRFELAAGGTLFLDEIGELPPETQVKLLRVLQSREFERIGGSNTIQSDFRLITATNRDLEKAVESESFRSDLYYRLNIFPVTVPPLRERKGDISELAMHFLQKHSIKTGKRFSSFPESEMERLVAHDWPGNVRELENLIERGIISSAGEIFKVPDPGRKNRSDIGTEYDVAMSLDEVERVHILQVLKKTMWKVRGTGGAAELLKINPSTLYFRMKKLDINKERDR